MIIEHGPGRHTFHDLLRAYATNKPTPSTPTPTAAYRTLDHYLHTAHTADRLLNPARDSISLTRPLTGVTPERFTDYRRVLAWFNVEHPVLLAAVDRAAATGFDIHTWQLAWILTTFLDRRGHWHDWATTQSAALAAARRLADPITQAYAHRTLARAHASADFPMPGSPSTHTDRPRPPISATSPPRRVSSASRPTSGVLTTSGPTRQP
jgi:hypothetical protein